MIDRQDLLRQSIAVELFGEAVVAARDQTGAEGGVVEETEEERKNALESDREFCSRHRERLIAPYGSPRVYRFLIL